MPERLAEERLRALESVTDAALSNLPLEDMLAELLTRVRELLGVDTAAILLIDEAGENLVARAAKGLEAEVEQEVRIPVGRGFAGRIAEERRPVVITDVDRADIYNPILRQKGLKSLLGVPLLVEARLIGVLHVGTLSPRAFAEDDIGLLERAADRAAHVIGGRLAERDRGLVEAFQQSLIPPLPTVPGLSLTGRYKPAASAQLGGDWYDAFVLPTGAIGVAIGDVVGRGFRAAALMGQLRSALRAFAIDQRRPSEVLERLSTLLRQLQPGWGATVLYALLEPHAGVATISRAGHPPPLVVDEDGSSRFIDLPRSVPLGALRYPVYQDTRIPLGPGSTVILYTDGLVERPGEPLDTGLGRLQSALDGPPADAGELTDRLMKHLLPDGAERDDAALLVVTIAPLTDPFRVRLPADPDSIALVRRVIARWLTTTGASEEEIGEITLACSEACANAIEHAYGPASDEFEIEAASANGGVVLVIKDRGRWRSARGINRGRGMTLMEGLMDSVEVQRGERGTAVRLTRRLARRAA